MTTTTAPARHAAPRSSSMLRSIVPMLVLDIAVPILVFNTASNHGMSDTAAYLLAGVSPLVGILLHLARTRRLDVVGGLFLGMYAISAGIAAIPSADSRWLLLKDSAVTGAFGLLCLATLLPGVARPLMFHFGLRFATDGSPSAREQWDAMWTAAAGFRHSFRLLTLVWGVGMLAEAAAKVVVAETLPFRTAYDVNQVLPAVVFGALMAWTVARTRRGRRRMADAAAPAGRAH